MNVSLTRPGGIRIPAASTAPLAPVAVLAETAGEARSSASSLRARLPAAEVIPATLAGYLGTAAAPARVILCATRRPAAAGLAFLTRASARLLWPAPPADIDAAIGGLRDSEPVPRRGPTRARPRRSGRPTAALLLEGAVDHIRTRAALAAVEGAGAGPRDWIVESVRHVAVPARRLAALERAGIRWCALEPVELLAVCAGAALARSVRNQPWLPAGTPVWITPPQRIR